MPDNLVQESPGASRRVYIWWAVGLGLLLLLGLFCGIILKPVLEARAAVQRCHADNSTGIPYNVDKKDEIKHLGGPRVAASKLRLYLKMPERWAPHRPAAAWLIGECGEQATCALPELLELLQVKNGASRRAAAWALGMCRDPRAATPLLAALEDKDDALAAAAAIALGRIGAAEVIEPLINALCSNRALTVRYAAAFGLGRSRDSRAFDPLVAALKSEPATLRAAAASALGGLGDRRAIDLLAACLKDPVHPVRNHAAQALAELGDPRAVPFLEEALKDEKPENYPWRDAAERAIEKLHAGAEQQGSKGE
jgi:hypothetical protein